MKDIDRSEKLEPAGSDMKETFAILFFGLAAAAVLIYHMGILDYDALTVLFIVPIIMLATAKGFRYGALLSVICGAMFGTLTF